MVSEIHGAFCHNQLSETGCVCLSLCDEMGGDGEGILLFYNSPHTHKHTEHGHLNNSVCLSLLAVALQAHDTLFSVP